MQTKVSPVGGNGMHFWKLKVVRRVAVQRWRQQGTRWELEGSTGETT